MKRKDFLANRMKAGMGRELLVPLFDANSQPEKRLCKIYHHKVNQAYTRVCEYEFESEN